MILIGEKINGAIPKVAEAIKQRDRDFIMERAKLQAQAGVQMLDCCAATKGDEAEALLFLAECVEEATDLPICLDSSDVEVLGQVAKYMKRPGILNSVSLVGDKAEKMFRLLATPEMKDWGIVVLLMDEGGIPGTVEQRLAIFEELLEKAGDYGIAPERLYIDPMVEMLCTSEAGASVSLKCIEEIRRRNSDVHILVAVSNVSWHLPARSILHQAFAVMAAMAGADCLILDPLDRRLMGMLHAAEALLGEDEFCLSYIEAYRAGKVPAEK